MLKYNWITIPEEIKTKYIFSAFSNPVDIDKLTEYTEKMSETLDIEYNFPPIMWYPIIIDQDLYDEYEWFFINGEYIEDEDFGKVAWCVTDWHHRSLAAFNSWKIYIDVELDRSTITDEDELTDYDKI